jgi:hypothetical protein
VGLNDLALLHRKKVFFFATALIFCIIGFIWSVASPIGSSPDEDAHIGSIWCAQGYEEGLCSPSSDGNPSYALIPLKPNICYKFVSSDAANCGAHSGWENVRTNNVNYPQLFYKFNSLFITSNPVNSIVLMRTINFLTYVTLTMFAIALLPRRLRIGFSLAWLLTLIPLGIFVAASINPSSWALTGLFTASIFTVALFSEENSFKVRSASAVGLFFASTIALGSRPDSRLYLPVIVALAIYWSSKKFSLTTLMSKLVFLALFTGFGYFLLNRLLSSITSFPNQDRTADLSLLFYNIPRVFDLWFGVFGVGWGTGWLDTLIPSSIATLLSGIYLYFVFSALSDATRKSKQVLVVGLIFFIALVLVTLQLNHLVVGEELQPRYFLPFIAAITGIYLASSSKLWALSRVQKLTILMLFTYAHAYSLYWNLKRYITGIDDQSWSLDRNMEWWFNDDWASIHIVHPSTFLSFGSILFLLGILAGVRWLTLEDSQASQLTSRSLEGGAK